MWVKPARNKPQQLFLSLNHCTVEGPFFKAYITNLKRSFFSAGRCSSITKLELKSTWPSCQDQEKSKPNPEIQSLIFNFFSHLSSSRANWEILSVIAGRRKAKKREWPFEFLLSDYLCHSLLSTGTVCCLHRVMRLFFCLSDQCKAHISVISGWTCLFTASWSSSFCRTMEVRPLMLTAAFQAAQRDEERDRRRWWWRKTGEKSFCRRWWSTQS